MSRLTELEFKALKSKSNPATLCITLNCPQHNGQFISCSVCAVGKDKRFLDLCQDLQISNIKKC